MITLYFTPNSPYARKVRIVLAEKGLAFTPESLPATPPSSGRVFPESFETMNPNMRVPMLADNDLRIWDSNLILEYLFATYPHAAKGLGQNVPPLAPTLTRPERHWQDLMILNTIETLLDSAINVYQFTRDGMRVEQVPYLRREKGRTQSELDWLEKQLPAEGFWPGMFSVMDVNLVCTLAWLDLRKPVPWRGRPKLEAIMERYGARPSVQATRPPG